MNDTCVWNCTENVRIWVTAGWWPSLCCSTAQCTGTNRARVTTWEMGNCLSVIQPYKLPLCLFQWHQVPGHAGRPSPANSKKWRNWWPFAFLWNKIGQFRKQPPKLLQVTNCETPMYFPWMCFCGYFWLVLCIYCHSNCVCSFSTFIQIIKDLSRSSDNTPMLWRDGYLKPFTAKHTKTIMKRKNMQVYFYYIVA